MAKLCLCGCGEVAREGKRFINGHNSKGENNPFYNKHHQIKTKRQLSISVKESHKNKKYGFQKGQIPFATTSYGKCSICDAEYEVRSSYERLVSDWLFAYNIKHFYEFKRFYFGNYSYLPDYYIPELDLWIEIKGYMDTKSKIQIKLFKAQGYKLLVLDKKFFQQNRLFERVLERLFNKLPT